MLENAKWEKLALGLARGMNQADAYEAAGFKATGKAADACCSRLLKTRPEIGARIEEIKARYAESTEQKDTLDRAWVLERLMRNARICMGDEKVKLTIKPKGLDETVDLDVTMRDAAAANQALTLLGKELQMFVERTENTHVVRDITDQPATETEWTDRHVTAH